MENEKTGLFRTLTNLLFVMRPYWRYAKPVILIDVLTRAIIYPIRVAAETTIAQAVIEAAMSGRGTAHTLLVAGVYIAVIILCWGARQARMALYTNWKFEEINANIGKEIYEQAMRTDFRHIDDPAYFDNYKQAVERYEQTANTTYSLVIEAFASFVTLITVIGIIASTSPFVIVIAIIGIAIASIFRARLNTNDNAMWKKTTPYKRKMNYLTRLLYTKSANSDFRSTNSAQHVLSDYDRARDTTVEITKSYKWKQFFNGNVIHIADQLSVFVVTVYVALGLVSGRIASIGVFTTMIAATSQMNNMFSNISYYITDLLAQSLYAEKIRQFFELKSEIETQEGGIPAPNDSFELTLRNVSFAYPNSDFALKNISMTIPRGAKIAIVGENGAGKTTLSKLLLRLYEIEKGEICINGVPLREYEIHNLRHSIGVAFQEPQLYAISVRANMQVYHSADDETLENVLRLVGLNVPLAAEVTREFDQSGVMLSGGQAQKLGLARLLHGKFGLLLLDEPSSALDPLAEYEMTKLLFDRVSSTTTIMVAHRLSTVRNADMIYLIANGELAEQGTHNELMRLGGKYAEMFIKQAENYAEV